MFVILENISKYEGAGKYVLECYRTTAESNCLAEINYSQRGKTELEVC